MDYLQEAKDKIRSVVSYNPETGVFVRLVAAPNSTVGSILGSVNKHGYIVFSFLGKIQYAHRLSWLYMTGEWPTKTIDHINGIRSDNRWSNLRHVSKQGNCQNRTRMKIGKQSPIGVHFDKSRRLWLASITASYKTKFLGYANSEKDAELLYLTAKAKLHTEGAYG